MPLQYNLHKSKPLHKSQALYKSKPLHVSSPLYTSTSFGQGGRGVVNTGAGVRQVGKRDQNIPDRVKEKPGHTTQFYPKSVKLVDGELKIILVPGYAWFDDPFSAASDPGVSPAWLYVMPEKGTGAAAVTLDADEPPEFLVGSDESIYAKVERSGTGVVTPPVEIVVMAENEIPDHYQPQDPEQVAKKSEHAYIEILKVKTVDGKLIIKQLHSGPLRFVVTLVGGENLGGGSRPYKRYERTTGLHQYRTHVETWGVDVAESAGGETIEHRFDGINVGGGGAILKTEVESAGGANPTKAEHRTITQGPSGQQQITIDTLLDVVRVYGNGANGSLRVEDCDGAYTPILTWVDGLITTTDVQTIVTGECNDPT
jgi:hypothetical protein